MTVAPEHDHRWVALVPMRHHSERVPEKNYRPLAGKPLYAYILEALLQVEQIELIVVNTDSDEISQGITQAFPAVRLLDRPASLRAGDIPMNDVIAHDVGLVDSRFYLQTHSTNPLLKPETIAAAIASFESNYPECDSLFAVTRLQTRLWTKAGEPINHNPTELLRTQDLEPIYEENSCFYLFERERFKQSGNRIGDQPLLFEVSFPENLDIDTEEDWDLLEALISG